MFDEERVIAEESAQLAAAVERARSAEDEIPLCPGWSVRDLATHIAGVQAFWAERIRTGDPPEELGDHFKEPPPELDPPGLAAWYRPCAAALLDAVRAAPAGAPCWTWWGEPATVAAVRRHQVQEVAVHRWDAESASGNTKPLPAEAATDGVGEFLEIMLGVGAGQLTAAVALEAADTGASWTVGPGAPAATVRGTASDLVLCLYRRVDLSTLDVGGDVSAAAALIAAANAE